MELSIEVEKPSSILRKMTVRVPAKEVKSRFDRSLMQMQKTANLKGFRPGQAPISIVKQYYGEDVRHRLLHNLIDESFDHAVREHKLRAIGSPQIDTPDHKTGEGAHDHTILEDKDFTFIATFEVMPEVEVKGYTGLSVTQDKVEVTDEDLAKVIDNLRQSHGQLVPVTESRGAQTKDFVDIHFAGGIVTENGVEAREEMKGSRMLEIGSQSFMPGFEDQLIGMKQAETKTFRLTFPNAPEQGELAGKEAEFTVTVNEIKEMNLPTVDDEFAKQMKYDSVADLNAKITEYMQKERADESQRKLKSDLIAAVLEKNKFDIPESLIMGQTRLLVQEWVQELKRQKYDQKMIEMIIGRELPQLKTKAESQVRASLVLESVAKQEEILTTAEDVTAELAKMAQESGLSVEDVGSYYEKDLSRKEDLEFRIRQEKSLSFLISKAKIKQVARSKEA